MCVAVILFELVSVEDRDGKGREASRLLGLTPALLFLEYL